MQRTSLVAGQAVSSLINWLLLFPDVHHRPMTLALVAEAPKAPLAAMAAEQETDPVCLLTLSSESPLKVQTGRPAPASLESGTAESARPVLPLLRR